MGTPEEQANAIVEILLCELDNKGNIKRVCCNENDEVRLRFGSIAAKASRWAKNVVYYDFGRTRYERFSVYAEVRENSGIVERYSVSVVIGRF